MEMKGALVTGNVAKVKELVAAGSIVAGTLVVTSVGNKICLVRKDNTVSVLSDDEHIFESTEEVNAYLATEEAKAGQTIVVKESDGTYKQYILNQASEGGIEIGEPTPSSASIVWQEL